MRMLGWKESRWSFAWVMKTDHHIVMLKDRGKQKTYFPKLANLDQKLGFVGKS